MVFSLDLSYIVVMKALKKRILGSCCGAHILHDGYTDLLYVMFPIWQMAFGLSLAEVGSLKTLYSGAMASLQVPSSMLSEKVGEKRLLLFGTLIAAIGLKDIIIVHTPTATLVADKRDENSLKKLIAEMEKRGLVEYL